jgi:hypothetical protein
VALQIWLPLTGHTRNRGAWNSTLEFQPSNTNFITVDNSGKLGQCYAFNSTATNSGIYHVDGNYMADHINNKSFSICAWIQTTATDTCVISLSYGLRLFVGDASHTYITLYNSSRTVGCAANMAVNDGKWHHVCGIYNVDTNKIQFYVDGVKKNEVSYTSGYTYASSWNNGLFIGRDPNNSTVNDHYHYKGKMNDVRVYDHALSVAEVKELAKGLVCHYKLDTIGLENLLAYSKVNDTNKTLLKNNINSNWNNRSIVTIDGYQGYHYPSATSPTGWSSGWWYKSLEANTTYTYSAWIYFTASANFNFTSLGHFQVYNSGSSASDKSHEDVAASRIYEPSTIPANKWTKVRITFTTNSLGGSYFQIYPRYNIAANKGDLYFRDCKLEKNSTPTSWVPNSADNEYKALGFGSTTIADNSGFGYNGTKTGTITNSSDAPRYSSSTKFASGSHINVSLVTSGFANSYTFSWWGKYSNYSSHMMWGFSNGNRLNLYMSGGNFYWNTGDGNSNPFNVSAATYGDNQWHHFAVTGDGTTTKLYIDGAFKANAKTYKGITGTTIYMNGWDSGTSYNFNGQLSDFRLYATCLSADDIKRLYEVSASVSKNGAMLGYEMKEG